MGHYTLILPEALCPDSEHRLWLPPPPEMNAAQHQIHMDANLIGISPQILRGYEKLDAETKQKVYIVFLNQKKDRDKAFGLSFLAGAHMPYLGQTGKFILFLLTMGGYGIWYLIEIINSKSVTDKYNTKLFNSIIAPWIKEFEEAEKLIAEEERKSMFYKLHLARIRTDFQLDNGRPPNEEEEKKLDGLAEMIANIEYPKEIERRHQQLNSIKEQLKEREQEMKREQMELSIKLMMGKCPRCYKPVSRIASKCPHCTADI